MKKLRLLSATQALAVHVIVHGESGNEQMNIHTHVSLVINNMNCRGSAQSCMQSKEKFCFDVAILSLRESFRCLMDHEGALLNCHARMPVPLSTESLFL